MTWKNWFDIHGNVHALKSFKVDNSTLLRICFIFNFRCLSTTCKKCCSLETTVTGRNARWWWWKKFWLKFRLCFQRNKNYETTSTKNDNRHGNGNYNGHKEHWNNRHENMHGHENRHGRDKDMLRPFSHQPSRSQDGLISRSRFHKHHHEVEAAWPRRKQIDKYCFAWCQFCNSFPCHVHFTVYVNVFFPCRCPFHCLCPCLCTYDCSVHVHAHVHVIVEALVHFMYLLVYFGVWKLQRLLNIYSDGQSLRTYFGIKKSGFFMLFGRSKWLFVYVLSIPLRTFKYQDSSLRTYRGI